MMKNLYAVKIIHLGGERDRKRFEPMGKVRPGLEKVETEQEKKVLAENLYTRWGPGEYAVNQTGKNMRKVWQGTLKVAEGTLIVQDKDNPGEILEVKQVE